jgi:hypothetical protein
MAAAPLKLPYNLPAAERDEALAAARRAVDQQPQDADQHQLELARGKALEPFVTAHERRDQEENAARERRLRAEHMVKSPLSGSVENCITRMERDGELEFDSGAERSDLKWKVADAIRQPVVEWAGRINNLSDHVLQGEIERAASRCIEELVPEQ